MRRICPVTCVKARHTTKPRLKTVTPFSNTQRNAYIHSAQLPLLRKSKHTARRARKGFLVRSKRESGIVFFFYLSLSSRVFSISNTPCASCCCSRVIYTRECLLCSQPMHTQHTFVTYTHVHTHTLDIQMRMVRTYSTLQKKG